MFYIKSGDVGSNSYNVMERGRINEFGEAYCVSMGETYEDARHITDALNRDEALDATPYPLSKETRQ